MVKAKNYVQQLSLNQKQIKCHHP